MGYCRERTHLLNQEVREQAERVGRSELPPVR